MRNEKDKDPWTNLRVRRSTVRILDRLGVLMAKERRMLKPLSQQEAAHHHVLSFEIKMVSQNRMSFGEVKVDLAPVQKFVQAVDQVLKAAPPPSLEEAVRLALKFEQEAGQEHYCLLLTQQGNPGVEALVKSMHNLRAANHAHLSELEEFARRRGFISSASQAVAAPVLPAE